MQFVIVTVLTILSLSFTAKANVEKLIFVGPSSSTAPLSFLSPNELPSLELLSPSAPDLRRKLHSAFPHSPPLSEPSEAFVLLADLEERRRYEVRICWPATQPTSFDLTLLDPASLSKGSPLTTALSNYIASRQTTNAPTAPPDPSTPAKPFLLLQVKATADYFSSNATLMREGLLVDVDIILDPYILNIFPRSLLPTGIHILLIALLSWPVAGLVWRHLLSVTATMQDVEAEADAKSAKPVKRD